MARRRQSKDQQTEFGEFPRQRKTKKPIGFDSLINIEPLTDNQRKLFDSYSSQKHIVAYGCAGTGKSFISLYNALREVLDENSPVEKVYIVRSLVATREIGFLPGPQPLDAKILTPNGWTTMGKINVGDYVIGRDGKPTKVTAVFPKGKKFVYKINTTENTSTECCEDHLWVTKTFEDKKRSRVGSTKTTKQILETLLDQNGKINHYIPRNEAVEFTQKNLPIPPYTLGVILGDGSISNSIAFSSIDNELIEKVRTEVSQLGCYLTNHNISYTISNSPRNNKPARMVLVTNTNTKNVDEYYSIGDALQVINQPRSKIKYYCENKRIIDGIKYEFIPSENKWENKIKNSLFQLGLEKTKSNTKFIPDLYKFSSIEDRIELLRGLMDTDGTVKEKTGGASYTTTSKQLALDVIELVKSLGGRSTIRERNRIGKTSNIVDRNGKLRVITSKLISYEFTISLPNHINPFYITRKSKRFSCNYMHHIGIKSIEPICEKEVQCIQVDNSENLYITDDYIVTHNSHDDKADIYQIPYKNMVKYMFQMSSDVDFEMLYGNLKSQETIKFWSTSFLRGTTLDNAVIIVDEFSNLSFHELDSIITRVGENSRIIFTGDTEQSDLLKQYERDGVGEFLKILKTMISFDTIEFTVDDICRSGLVKEYLIAKHDLGIFYR
jgi:phosphate starvation-inducible protein PhoH